jgi:hypothetical protein
MSPAYAVPVAVLVLALILRLWPQRAGQGHDAHRAASPG